MNARIWKFALRVAESRPLLWKIGYAIALRAPFLMPHDKSYMALKHFIVPNKKGLFLDVGANNGISILSFRAISNCYSTLSLEPNIYLEPSLAKITQRSSSSSYLMVGAGSRAEELSFYTPKYKSIVLHTATSSNLEQAKKTVLKFYGSKTLAATSFVKFQAKVITIDSLKLDPDIIKIDVEGMDLQVLQGAIETIKRSRPYIMAEVAWDSKNGIINFFNNLDYQIFSYDVEADDFRQINSVTLNADQNLDRNYFAVPVESVIALKLKDLANNILRG